MTGEQVVARYQAAYGRLRADTVARVLAAWGAYGGLSDADADRFVSVAIPIIEGAQAATGALVAGYMGTLSRVVTGESDVEAVPAAELTVEALRGVSAAEVYRRPIVAARTAISDGKNFVDAVAAGRERLEQIADTDVAMAQRQATLQVVSSSDRITGYRRVLTGRSCAFCATASTQRYKRAQLAPLHSRCDCGVAPIIGDADPGQVINRRLLKDIKSAAKQGGKADYWKSRHFTVAEDGSIEFPPIKVHEHGELGPVLGAADHHFAGPSVAA